MVLIKTNEAKCRDCYKCVRICPLKAICIKSGPFNIQTFAQVLEESCVQCGRCTTVCPQKAKVVKSDLKKVKALLLNREKPVVASVAPSFPVQLPLVEPLFFPALLKRLGFSYVGLTAVGAELISQEHIRSNPGGPVISSACPVVVNLVELHYPQFIPYLSTLVSPMIAHARLLKKQYPDSVIVFIGPCIAKKGEVLSEEVKGSVDYVLDFEEVWNWIQSDVNDLEQVEPVEFDGYLPDKARLFPAEGGQLLTTSLSTDILDSSVQTVTGLQNCISLLDNYSALSESTRPRFIEMLACRGGCLGGPYTVTGDDVFSKKQRLLDITRRGLQKNNLSAGSPPSLPSAELKRKYHNRKVEKSVPNEEQIKEILAQSGKFALEDELNCGACGFSTCREKAAAVFQGHAELQMCIPYMRKRAEISNMVLSSMPNGVIIANEDLVITEINAAALQMFGGSSETMIGRKLVELIDPTEFERVLREKRMVKTDSCYLKNGVATRQVIFPLEDLVVGIFIDITKELTQENELMLVKTQTINRAQEVIKKQMTVAQEIAGLLGETTAETKILLNQLIKLMRE